MSKLCQSCNHENLDKAIYCAKCGAKLKIKTADTNKASSGNSEKEKNIDTKLIRQIQIGIFSVIALIVISSIVTSFILSNDLDKVKRQSYYSSNKNTNSIEEDAINKVSSQNIIKDNKDKNVIELEKVKTIQNVSTNMNIIKEHIHTKWKCNIQWIIDKGEKYKPTNKNLQILSIELINKMDRLHLKTQNGESKYNYSSFIDLDDDNLGMEYIYDNRFIGIFQDGSLLMGDRKSGVDAKYYCKDMTLDIIKFTSHKSKKIIEKEIISPIPSKIPQITNSVEKFSLTIQTIPFDAIVRVLNIKPKYYDGMKLKKGKYHIEVLKKGYRTIDKWIILKQNENFNFELKKIKKYIAPKVIKDEHVISHDSYSSPKIIKYEDPINNYTIPKQMTQKELKNYNKCLTGRNPILCEHSWLTSQQASEVKIAERRVNYNKCLTGRNPILCEHSWLTSQQESEVKIAERRVNYNKCLTGRNPILCEHSWLTSQQESEVKIAERRVNYNKCLTGRNPILCEHSWLTSQQANEVKIAERRINYNKCLTGRNPILCEHSWLTSQQASEVKIAERRAGN